MKNIKTDTLIIGAGPAGLSCAVELSKAGKDFIIVEKSSSVGGLSKTYKFIEEDGLCFYTDNGPHRFFSKNNDLYSFISELLGDDWIRVSRYTRQFIDGKFYDYPVNLPQALKNIGFVGDINMLIDYLWAKIVYKIFRKKIQTFKDYAIANFGKSLAYFNIINYTEKIWGISADKIHAEWALQRIKGLNVTSVVLNYLKKLFSKNGDSPKSLIDEFFYPSRGTGLIYNTIAEKLNKMGYLVVLDTYPTRIQHENNQITKVVLRNKTEEIVVECNNLVESIPITEFVTLLEPEIPKEVKQSILNLKHRSQVYLFITLNKDTITKDQWIYFPSKKNKIARISEMKNFSKMMSPKHKTSLFVEFFCFKDDEIWNKSKDELFEIALKELSSIGLFDKTDVRSYYHIKMENVYPVYDLNYQTHLSTVKQCLNGFNNLYYIGRPGRFRYNNQDHSLEMGMLTAKSIIDGVMYDIEAVGEEKEYYEKGYIVDKKSTNDN